MELLKIVGDERDQRMNSLFSAQVPNLIFRPINLNDVDCSAARARAAARLTRANCCRRSERSVIHEIIFSKKFSRQQMEVEKVIGKGRQFPSVSSQEFPQTGTFQEQHEEGT